MGSAGHAAVLTPGTRSLAPEPARAGLLGYESSGYPRGDKETTQGWEETCSCRPALGPATPSEGGRAPRSSPKAPGQCQAPVGWGDAGMAPCTLHQEALPPP